MHWLPLVAMVIASALFSPHCPGVPRLVAATMEPGNNFSSTRSLVNPVSRSDDTHAEYVSSRKKTAEKVPHRTPGTHLPMDLSVTDTSSIVNEDVLFERNQYKKAKPGRLDLGLENHIHRDYKSTEGQFQEDSKLETHTEGGGWRNRKNEEVSMGRLTFKEWPRHLHPADVPREDMKEAGREETRTNTLPTMPAVPPEGLGLGLDGLLQVDDELLLLETNPRVLFSTSPSPPKHPPLQVMLDLGLMPEQQEEHAMDDKELKMEKSEDGEASRNLQADLSDSSEHASPSLRRRKRQLLHTGIERSVCESTSSWVMDRRTAIDVHMQNVTVLEKFPTKKGMMTQYFYETRCRGPDHRGVSAGEHGLAGAGCLGVDKRHWVSECQTKQSYVRAFTSDNTRGTGWRWIRIDTSCVCVLYSRTQNKRTLTTRQGTR